MFPIIQDYKDYRKTKKTAQAIKDRLDKHFKGMVKPVSLFELKKYNLQASLLVKYGNIVLEETGIEGLNKYLEEKAPLVHAPSCFCTTFASSYLKDNPLANFMFAFPLKSLEEQERSALNENNVVRCIHNHEDGKLSENYCANCPPDRFKALLEFHSLKGDLQRAQEQQKQAKEKLLAHLPFYRIKK